jgi:hypothetical protein
MIEVKIVNTTTYIDPRCDLQYQGEGVIDENHSLLQAQRLGRALQAAGVTTYRGRAVAEELAAAPIRPSMILMKPNILKMDPNNPMPIVPEKPQPKQDEHPGKLAAR